MSVSTISTPQRISCNYWIFLNLIVTSAAFTFNRITIPPHQQVVSTRCFAGKNSDELLSLMDEAVSLYSRLNLSIDDVNDDIVSLRKREVVELVENTIGSLTSGSIQSSEEDSGLVVVDGVVDAAAVAQLSKRLDKAILIDYQPTFTNEEYDEWIKNIEIISSELDNKLKGVKITSMPQLSAAPPTKRSSESIHGLRVRLDQLKTLISPPLATQRQVSVKHVSAQKTPVTAKKNNAEPNPVKSGEKANKDPLATVTSVELPLKDSAVVDGVDTNYQMVEIHPENEDENSAAAAVVSIAVVAILGETHYIIFDRYIIF